MKETISKSIPSPSRKFNKSKFDLICLSPIHSADLAIKNMRYLARFVVVSVLMNNFELVSKLTESLKIAVDHYAKTFKAVDVNDWNAVVQEIVTFLSAVQKSSVVDSEKRILSFSARINKENGVQIGRDIQKLRLQEAVVVGLFPDQVSKILLLIVSHIGLC